MELFIIVFTVFVQALLGQATAVSIVNSLMVLRFVVRGYVSIFFVLSH